jgi:hypothetical protein
MAGASSSVTPAQRRAQSSPVRRGAFLVSDRPDPRFPLTRWSAAPEKIPPMTDNLTRREFVQEGAVAAVALASGLATASIVQAGNPTNQDTSKILNLQP